MKLCISDTIGRKELTLEVVRNLLSTLLKRFRKLENSVKENFNRMKLPINKIMIVEINYELNRATHFSQNLISGHYTTVEKLKKVAKVAMRH